MARSTPPTTGTPAPGHAVSSLPSQWSGIASRWEDWGPPLRPGPEDLETVSSMVRICRASAGPGPWRVLMWGVTPELASLDWPASTELLALERSEMMIRSVWPGDVPGRRAARQADWLDAAGYPEAPYHLILGDGTFNCVAFPDAYRAKLELAHRTLAPGGEMIVRVFVRPAQAESPEDVAAALQAGQIGNFHVYKFRLAMALPCDAQRSVRVADVYAAWAAGGRTAESFAAETGWPVREISTIECYREQTGSLSFPHRQDLEALLETRFELVDVHTPGYEMGDRCPLYRLRKR